MTLEPDDMQRIRAEEEYRHRLRGEMEKRSSSTRFRRILRYTCLAIAALPIVAFFATGRLIPESLFLTVMFLIFFGMTYVRRIV